MSETIETKKRKVEFNDKENSIILNSDSAFVLTAENINEIKEVVNNLADELANRLRFNHVFKYARFNIPNTLKKDCNYTFKCQLSTTPSFKNDGTIELSPDEQPSIFSIFNNEKWEELAGKSITKLDIDKTIKIDISDYVSDENKCYFGRCKWINTTTNEEDDWQGFALSIFECNDSEFEKKIITDYRILGESNLYEDNTYGYSIVLNDNVSGTIDVTNEEDYKTEIKSLFGKIGTNDSSNVFEYNSDDNKFYATSSKVHNIEYDIIEATFIYENIKYTSYLNVIINPVILEKLEIVKNFDEIKLNNSYSFSVNAYWNDGSSKDVTENIETSLILGECTISKNVITGNGRYDSFGILSVTYYDEDFPELENLSENTYLVYTVPKFKSFNISFPKEIYGDERDTDLTYSVKIELSDDTILDITNDVEIKIIDCEDFECKEGIISLGELTEKRNVSIIFSYHNPQYSNLNCSEIINVLLNPKILMDIEVEFYNSNNIPILDINENSTVIVGVSGIYYDDETNVLDDFKILQLSNINCEINGNTISIKEHEYSSIGVFKISYGKFEKIKYLGINPVYVSKLEVMNSPMVTQELSNLTVHFKAHRNDGYISSTNSNDDDLNKQIKIELAAGNPNLVTMINENVISFGESTFKNEALCFLATYQNKQFESEIKTAFFIVQVIKKEDN